MEEEKWLMFNHVSSYTLWSSNMAGRSASFTGIKVNQPKWWVSIAMFDYQRVLRVLVQGLGDHCHIQEQVLQPFAALEPPAPKPWKESSRSSQSFGDGLKRWSNLNDVFLCFDNFTKPMVKANGNESAMTKLHKWWCFENHERKTISRSNSTQGSHSITIWSPSIHLFMVKCWDPSHWIHFWLLVDRQLEKMMDWTSVGMMTFTIYR